MRCDASTGYPPFWKGLSWVIRHIRAQGRCEWCGAKSHEPHPVTGGRVVLTVAHLVNKRPDACDYLNLASLCQKCHFGYDRPQHAATRRRKRTRTDDLFGGGGDGGG